MAALTARLLARALYYRDDLRGAIQECAKALGYSEEPRTQLELARYLVVAGNKEEARPHLETAIRADTSLFAVAEKEGLFGEL